MRSITQKLLPLNKEQTLEVAMDMSKVQQGAPLSCKRKLLRAPRKRSFLLLEVLIAFTLLITCFFPLLKPHLWMRKERLNQLEQWQLHRLSRLAIVEVKRKLYEHKYPWGKLKEGFEEELADAIIYINKKEKPLKQTFAIKPIQNYTKRTTGDHYLFLELQICYGKSAAKTFSTFLFIENRK